MYLKGIAFFPRFKNSDIAELADTHPEWDRAVRDLALSVAKTAPKTIVYLSQGEPSFTDALAVLYQPGLMGKCGDRWLQMTGDLNLMNDFHDRLNESGVDAVFINDTEAERYDITPVIPQPLNAAVTAIDRVYPDHESVVVNVGGVDHTTLYRAGRILRQAIESGDRDVMIAVAADQRQAGGFLEALEGQDTAGLMALLEKPAESGDLAADIMAAGATDGIYTRWHDLGKEGLTGVGRLDYDLDRDDPTYESLLAQIDRKRTAAHRKVLSGADPYVGLAMAAVEKWVRENAQLDSELFLEKYKADYPDDVARMTDSVEASGVFVTLFKSGEVRGWAGGFRPTAPDISREIVKTAIAAASEDPRFLQIETEELNQITAKVDIVTDVEDVWTASEIDPKKEGVVVEKGLRASFVMPDASFDSAEQAIAKAKERAGIPADEPDDEREFGGDKLFVRKFTVETHALDA